ncbi:hypothetical protein V8E55_007433 [Tylopilus felleus]
MAPRASLSGQWRERYGARIINAGVGLELEPGNEGIGLLIRPMNGEPVNGVTSDERWLLILVEVLDHDPRRMDGRCRRGRGPSGLSGKYLNEVHWAPRRRADLGPIGIQGRSVFKPRPHLILGAIPDNLDRASQGPCSYTNLGLTSSTSTGIQTLVHIAQESGEWPWYSPQPSGLRRKKKECSTDGVTKFRTYTQWLDSVHLQQEVMAR